ncbi:MAG: imidazole glycerol phosphate synthase subunit HisH [Saprospiraceae bacterium]|jgi:glutamine amidotransferase
MKEVVIVKYNAGNVQSVQYALDRLGVRAVWSDDPATIRGADRVIFPGVGAAKPAMAYLKAAGLDDVIRGLKQPVLGICLGLQLFCTHSEEGDTDCMGILPNSVRKFVPCGGQKVPHMGWNTLTTRSGLLFEGVASDAYFYFVHSYYATIGINTVGSSDYLLPFSAALAWDNFYAVQFHPEKSGAVGQRVLQNFLFG